MKYYGDGLLGYRDDEVRVSLGWEERGGKTYSSVVSEVCVIRTFVKVRLLGHQKMQAKKRMDNYGNCVLDVFLISMSMCPLYTTSVSCRISCDIDVN